MNWTIPSWLIAWIIWAAYSIGCVDYVSYSDGSGMDGQVCIPDCKGKCCGDDGCGGTCPDNCRNESCCELALCRCTTDCDWGCTVNSQCMEDECCIDNQCVKKDCDTRECGPDSVCGEECGPCPEGYICNQGACEPRERPLCPNDQVCIQANAYGQYGCAIPPNSVPSDAVSGCHDVFTCEGNYSCQCVDDNCYASACIENCGKCTADMACCLLWEDGPMGCLPEGCAELPPDPTFCDENTPCFGNATCYIDVTNNSFCINNCSGY